MPACSHQPTHPMHATHGQRGATLIVAVIVLMLITMTVISAFQVSKSNTQAVSNMQFRDEALAAANLVLEDVISLPNVETLLLAEGAMPVRYVDINQDGVDDLRVVVLTPRCIRQEPGASNEEESLSGVESNVTNNGLTNVVWEIQADVSDTVTEAQVSVVQGFRQQVSTVPASCS